MVLEKTKTMVQGVWACSDKPCPSTFHKHARQILPPPLYPDVQQLKSAPPSYPCLQWHCLSLPFRMCDNKQHIGIMTTWRSEIPLDDLSVPPP